MTTINLLAPWWEIWAARLFGERIERQDSGYTLVGYSWRRKLYITEWRQPPDPTSVPLEKP